MRRPSDTSQLDTPLAAQAVSLRQQNATAASETWGEGSKYGIVRVRGKEPRFFWYWSLERMWNTSMQIWCTELWRRRVLLAKKRLCGPRGNAPVN